MNNPVLITIVGNILHKGCGILQTCDEEPGANEQLE
jgi:hypothetical protein